MANPFDLASSMVGKSEVPDRAALRDYLTTGGANLDPATTAWCAAFVNSTLQQAGIKGTGSNLARSFLNYGQAVDTPQKGDLAVFSRGDPNGPYGHVGFFDRLNPDGTIRVLGGNQSDSVSFADYKPDRLLGYRRPGGTATIGSMAPATPAATPAAAPVVKTSNTGDYAAATTSAAIPPEVQALADGSAKKSMADVFGSMATQRQQEQAPAPVQIMGPSPEQATALSSFLQSLMQRRA